LKRDMNRLEQRFSHTSASRVPWVIFAERSAIADQDKHRQLVEISQRHQWVHTRKQAVILDNDRGLHPAEVSAHTDPDGLFLARDLDQRHFGVILDERDEWNEPCFRKRCNQADAGLLQPSKEELGALQIERRVQWHARTLSHYNGGL
jgi:hypothetical protein